MVYVVGFWHLLNYPTGIEGYQNAVTHRLTVLVLGLFVLISGFTLGRSSLSFSVSSFRAFYVKRFWRIYPPLALTALVFLGLGICDARGFLKAVTLTGIFVAPPPPTIWFICMIAVFYLVAPFLILLRRSWPRYLAACAIVQMLAYLAPRADHRLFLYFPCFAAGIALASSPLLNPTSKQSAALVLLACVSLLPTLGRPVGGLEQDYASTLWALCGSGAVFLILKTRLAKWTAPRVIAHLSAASFFMYLLHRPVYQLGLRVFPFDNRWAQTAFLVAICLPIVAILSRALQRLYDRLMTRGLRDKAGPSSSNP